MKYVAAYLLAILGGAEAPTEADVTKIITSIEGEVDAEQLALLFKAVDGKDLKETLKAGMKKLVNIGGGGGGAAPAAGGAAAAAAVEEEEEEEEEESVAAAGMFGDDESSS